MITNLFLLFLATTGGMSVESDVELLSKIITSECSICSFEEQYLVGSVVLNRVDHERFPNTVQGVIDQPHQFAGRRTRWFVTTPQTLKVAQDLLEGIGRDKIVYYFFRSDSRNQEFLRVMQKYYVYEKEFHIFAELEH